MKTSTRAGTMLVLLVVALALCFTFWEELQETLHLTYEHHSLSANRDEVLKSVYIYRNGYSTGRVQMQLSAELLATRTGDGELAAYLSQFIEVEGLHESVDDVVKSLEHDVPGVVADRVFNGHGEIIQTYADILSGDRLYLVAPGLSFMWPFVELGHCVTVTSEISPTKKPIIIESVLESPRTFRLHHFFSSEEAYKLIQHTLETNDPHNNMLPSSTVDPKQNKQKPKHRTSENVIDSVSDTAVTIRYRVFDVLSLGEYTSDICDGFQLLRCQQNQVYTVHYDFFPVDTARNSQLKCGTHEGDSTRYVTVLMYLSDVARNGETTFPRANMPESLSVHDDHPSNAAHDYEAAGAELLETGSWEIDIVKKCSTKLAFYPSKGDAVLIYNQKPNGEVDSMSVRGGCPMHECAKWGAILRIDKKKYRYNTDVVDNSCSITFTNPTSREVVLYWSDMLMYTLEANGGSIVYKTYTGSKWALKSGDHVLLEFVVDVMKAKKQTIIAPPIDENVAAQLEDMVAVKSKTSDNINTLDEL